MEKAYRILAINPGSTSTKIAIFTNEEMTFSRELKHSAEDLKDFHHINDQLDFRLQAVLTELKKDGIALRELDAVVARGGNMKPVVGGTYQVNEEMLRDLEIGVMGQHASHPISIVIMSCSCIFLFDGTACGFDEFSPDATIVSNDVPSVLSI